MGWQGQLTRAGLGLGIGLVIAEVAFHIRDDGAFPHINVLQPDDALAVRLTPESTQRIKIADNPTSTLTINAQGWRGEDFTQTGGIVVVGDSQVFGLGVDDADTTPAQLAALTGKPVYNGGVPTYGPEEYLQVIELLSASQQPEAIVIVLNFANDLFELGRPNRARHQVWDGWAVRLETAPESVLEFPGRHWLYAKSHAFYALRRLLYQPGEQDQGQGFPSEGSISDAMSAMLSQQLAEGGTPEAEIQTLLTGLAETSTQQRALDNELERLMREVIPYSDEQDLALQAIDTRSRPGDIVYEDYGEASREVEVTAALLRQGARLRRNMKRDFQQWLERNPSHPLVLRLRTNKAAQEALELELESLSSQIADELATTSPFEGFLQRASLLAERHEAELLVVALPLDVQVDPKEWQKYGEPVEDMSETLELLRDLTATAQRMGLRALDATDSLQAAQPGAFLNADIHLTPRGHQALAQAIADTLAAPKPLPLPGAGLPMGRTRVPLATQWAQQEENLVRGSTRNNCITRRLAEWQRITCLPPYQQDWSPVAVELESGSAESMLLSTTGQLDLLTPLIEGEPLSALFYWSNRVERLTLSWVDSEPILAFAPAPDAVHQTQASEEPLAACLSTLELRHHTFWFGDTERGCSETYTDCEALLSCAQGTRVRPPTCASGFARAGAAGHCHALCSDTSPCESGSCQDWMGAQVCL